MNVNQTVNSYLVSVYRSKQSAYIPEILAFWMFLEAKNNNNVIQLVLEHDGF